MSAIKTVASRLRVAAVLVAQCAPFLRGLHRAGECETAALDLQRFAQAVEKEVQVRGKLGLNSGEIGRLVDDPALVPAASLVSQLEELSPQLRLWPLQSRPAGGAGSAPNRSAGAPTRRSRSGVSQSGGASAQTNKPARAGKGKGAR